MESAGTAESGDKNSAADGRRGICSLALPSDTTVGLLEDAPV